jgi:hypothetical protein
MPEDGNVLDELTALRRLLEWAGFEILTADAPYTLKDGSLSPITVQLVDPMPVLKMIVEDFEFELPN